MRKNEDRTAWSCARRLRVLADATRLAVTERLIGGPSSVAELKERLGVDASLLSHHLRVLREAGLVVARREGRTVRYRLADGVHGAGAARLDLGCCALDFFSGARRGA